MEGPLEWSAFGARFTRESGIARLMEDLEEGSKAGAYMMGVGNPAQIPGVKREISKLVSAAHEGGECSELVEALSNYDGPRGKTAFLEALASFFRRELGWQLEVENLALTNGSQGGFFYIFNLLAGDGKKKILLPVCPEYLGYADLGLSEEFFVSAKPRIEVDEEDRSFKYRLDLAAASQLLREHGGKNGVGMVCVSRPTNPTGNVLTNEELADLKNLAKEHGVPLLVDGAYGLPFPRIQFAEGAELPKWSEEENMVYCFSLSKLGLPGVRTGVVLAPRQLTQAITRLNGILALAPGSVGPALALPLLKEPGRMARLCEEEVRPWYRERAAFAKGVLLEALQGERRVLCHRPEGCIFLWLWCRDLPVSSSELYSRLKAQKVYVIPGHFFFPGLANADKWAHTGECLRVSYAGMQDTERLTEGLRILAAVILEAYAGAPAPVAAA